MIAHNVANINTTGFKRSRGEFTDLLYQADRPAGVAGRGPQDVIPQGTAVGLGVRTVSIRQLNIQGTLVNTGNKYDLALNGNGWFQVQGANNETLYTRSGSFGLNAQGQLVTADGSLVIPNITIPNNATNVSISETGKVSANVNGSAAVTQLGQLTLASFVNDAGLAPLGGNLYRETPASGPQQIALAGDPGMGTIQQGYLESSNVDPVKEITDLIAAQRAYEMNSKVIQAADDMYSTVTKGIR